jgi:hypothetical protein
MQNRPKSHKNDTKKSVISPESHGVRQLVLLSQGPLPGSGPPKRLPLGGLHSRSPARYTLGSGGHTAPFFFSGSVTNGNPPTGVDIHQLVSLCQGPLPGLRAPENSLAWGPAHPKTCPVTPRGSGAHCPNFLSPYFFQVPLQIYQLGIRQLASPLQGTFIPGAPCPRGNLPLGGMLPLTGALSKPEARGGHYPSHTGCGCPLSASWNSANWHPSCRARQDEWATKFSLPRRCYIRQLVSTAAAVQTPPGLDGSWRKQRPESTRPLQTPGLAEHLMGVWNTQIEPRSG